MPATYFWITFYSCNLLKEQGSIDCNSNTHLQHMGVAEIKCYDNAQLDANYQKKNFFKHHRVGIFTHYNLKRWYNSFKLDSVKKHLVCQKSIFLYDLEKTLHRFPYYSTKYLLKVCQLESINCGSNILYYSGHFKPTHIPSLYCHHSGTWTLILIHSIVANCEGSC